MNKNTLVSICIPHYNSGGKVLNLINELLSLDRDDFEIVISDDCSDDGSWNQITKINSSQVISFKNEFNVGMDGNFLRVMQYANGKYVWLFGQDDFINANNFNTIIQNHLIPMNSNFFYVSNIKINENGLIIHRDNYMERIVGKGLLEYVNATDGNLPTFLPTFIIDKVSIKNNLESFYDNYKNTYYVQVGIFLDNSKLIDWEIIPNCPIVGFIPNDGWQNDNLKYVKIAIGYILMLKKASLKNPWISNDIFRKIIVKQRKRLIYSLAIIKALKLNREEIIFRDLIDFLRCDFVYYLAYILLLNMPQFVSKLIIFAIKFKRRIALAS